MALLICLRQPGTRRNIHPLIPIVVINRALSASSIYYDPSLPYRSIYVPDSVFPQSISKFSLVYLLAWHPPLHTPYISSPNRCLLFEAHAHTIATCFAVVPNLCHLILVSLNPLLGTLSCNLTPHIHLTILISAHWSATSFSFLTGQVSLPCNILLRIQLLYNLLLTINIFISWPVRRLQFSEHHRERTVTLGWSEIIGRYNNGRHGTE